MIKLLQEHVQELTLLCQKHHVQRFEVFGSAATGQFDTQFSDLDFLVEFLPLVEGQYADAYFDLLFELQDLFGRDVDLVTVNSIKNPYFTQAINQQKELLYAA
ncbi:MAG: nucleotidyltransferase family protein [Planctomycetota bacterium]|jgi:predicted nucleotidyltransferase